MYPTVYFLDKSTTFIDHTADTSSFDKVIEASEGISRAKVIQILENHNNIAIISENIDQCFASFAEEFKFVVAAGGVVLDNDGKTLMISRRGRWDLPKGHWEPGESIEECALREVAEETGVVASQILKPICNTFHTYNVYGVWELKCTHWFLMRGSSGETAPQQEEGIVAAEWLAPEKVCEVLRESYPTIRKVFASL
ncbi:MAG: NUDIX hydrolase [Alistipes sp.]|jgi:8-oxo-dGTP pyrophosphatase MutT (NUDIX family)|nr:NUDIX hydrolase [Alistipes sp.]